MAYVVTGIPGAYGFTRSAAFQVFETETEADLFLQKLEELGALQTSVGFQASNDLTRKLSDVEFLDEFKVYDLAALSSPESDINVEIEALKTIKDGLDDDNAVLNDINQILDENEFIDEEIAAKIIQSVRAKIPKQYLGSEF